MAPLLPAKSRGHAHNLAVPDFAQPLREADADPDPLAHFTAWFQAAIDAGVRAPEAMALATADRSGAPSVRMVLLKGHDERGFRFFTNHHSRKGRELEQNPQAALLFHWDALGRQVRIEGSVSRLPAEESAAYVRTRPRSSQLSALASPQSRAIPNREWLERRVAELAAQLGEREPPLPEHWGGYLLSPASFEFWQHREDRLHDRLLYTPAAGGDWRIQRLAP
jgi:pyridoxamine 5'-phosphate oxidase